MLQYSLKFVEFMVSNVLYKKSIFQLFWCMIQLIMLRSQVPLFSSSLETK